jgi:hypothetical protein
MANTSIGSGKTITKMGVTESDTRSSSSSAASPSEPSSPDPSPPVEEPESSPPVEVEPLEDPPEAEGLKEATHYVKTVNPSHRLALRTRPAYEEVSKEAAEDVDKKGDLVFMMPNGTVLAIVEPHVGYRCEWHQVEVVDKRIAFVGVQDVQKTNKLYCFAEFVQPLKGTAKMLPVVCQDCASKPLVEEKIFPDWPEKGLCDPWYDEETCSYYVAVTTKYERSTDEDWDAQQKDALSVGVDALLSFYDKERTPSDVKDYLAAFRFANVHSWNLNERPGSKLKFLVRIPAKYFDAIPESTDNLGGIPNGENGVLPKGWRSIHFLSSTLRETIEDVGMLLAAYADESSDWSGWSADYDFALEAERLRSFIPAFEKFLSWNSVTLDTEAEETIEIGFEGPCFKLAYVLYSFGGKMIPLKIGLGCFMKMEPIVFERTLGYVFYAADIISTFKRKKLPWSEFINTYACPPVVIRPAAPPTPAKIKKEPPIVEERPIKTELEMKQETTIVSSPPLKQRLADARKTVMHYIGDSLLSCDRIPQLLDQMTTLEDLYDKLLNKVDVKDITGFIVACLVGRLNIPDLRMLACKLVLKQLPIAQLQQVIQLFDQTVLAQIEDKLKYAGATEGGRVAKDDATRLRAAMQFVVSDDQICRTLTSFDPELIESKIRMLSNFKLPSFVRRKISVPTVKVPDNLSTEDIMAEIVGMIVEAVYRLLSLVLIELVKALFRALCSQCKPPSAPQEKYGAKNLNDVLKNARGLPEPENIGSKLFDDFGAGEGFSRDAIDSQMKDFFDDLSALLKPSELCELLNGQASKEVLEVARALIFSKYPAIRQFFSTSGKIKELFTYLGGFLTPEVCNTIAMAEKPLSFCDFNAEEAVRRSLLSEKLSEAQVEDQMNDLKERNKARLEDLMDLLDDNLLDGALPPLIHDPCKPGKSIMPYDPPSVKHLNNQVVDQMFGSLEMIFNQDLVGFLTNLIRDKEGQAKLPANVTALKQAVNANRKQLPDGAAPGMTPEDIALLKQDPDATGMNRGSEDPTYLAPGLREALQNWETVYKQDRAYSNDVASYVLSNFRGEALVDSINKKIQDKSKLTPLITTFVPLTPLPQMIKKTEPAVSIGGGVAKGALCEEEEKKASMVQGTFVELKEPAEVLPDDTVVRYKLDRTLSKAIEENDTVIVNRSGVDEVFQYKHYGDVNTDTKSLLGKYVKLPIGVSTKQDIFATFIMDILDSVLDDASRKKLIVEGQVYTYFRNNIYHRIVVDLLHMVLVDVSKSKLFNLADFQQVDFVGTMPPVDPCLADPQTGLMDADDLKQLVADRYQKSVNECSAKDTTMSPLEKSNLEGVVIAAVRLYVVEFLLKARFVFSRYRLKDIADDPLVTEYIAWEVEQDLKKKGQEFFAVFCAQSKKIVEGRGDRLQFGDASSINQKTLTDVLSSEYQSGLAFLKYLVGQQITFLSPRFEQLMNPEAVPLAQKLFEEQFRTVDVPKPPFVHIAADGFQVQRYIHVYSKGGKEDESVETWEEFAIDLQGESFVPVKCGSIGLRLVYTPKTADEESAFQELWESQGLKVSGDVTKRTRAFSLTGDHLHPIVLVSVEEEEVLESNKTSTINFYQRAEQLRLKMYEVEQFRLLFEGLFDLREYLSLVTIYNANTVARKIDGIDSSFDASKRYLRVLFRTLANTEQQDWWRREDDEIQKMGGNQGIYQERMDNIKASGPAPFLSGIVAKTIPIIIKGLAERFDPAYKILKQLDDTGAALWGLTWKSLLVQVQPVNIVPPPIGWGGPPIGPNGILALSLELLSGEVRDKQKREAEKAALDPNAAKKCDEDKTK